MIKNFIAFIKENFLQEKYLKMTRIQVSLGKSGIKTVPFIIDEFNLSENVNYKKILEYNFKTYFSDPKLLQGSSPAPVVIPSALRFFILLDETKNKLFCFCWPSDIVHQYFIAAVSKASENPITGYNFLTLYHDVFNKKEMNQKINLFPGTFDHGNFSSSSQLIKELETYLKDKGTSLKTILGINFLEIKSSF